MPAHNEAENIGAVVADVRAVLNQRSLDWELILVDDASMDDTVDVARAALEDDAQRLAVVRHPTQGGYAKTVGDGLRAARGRLLAFMDGDRQFNAHDLGRLIDRMSDSDMVAGIRAHRADPWHRSLVSGVMNLLVRTLYGLRRRDVDCGLKVFRREVFDRASPLLARSALFNTELFFKAQRLGYRVEQVPVEHLPRVAGRRSGARLVPIMRALRDLVALRLRLALRWRPVVARTVAPSATRVLLLFTPALAVYVLARLPSFWEPHWYTDEAGYVTTAQTLLHGHALYSQIWTNKPPLTVLIVAAMVHFFGTGEGPLHLLTAASGLATVGAVYWAAGQILGPRRAVVASLFAALALGLPVLDAELILPESLLIAPVSWAGALIAVRMAGRDGATREAPRGLPLWPLIAGALVAAGIAMQQSVLAETLAFTLALLISPAARVRDAAAFLGTVIVLTAGWLLAVIAIAGVHTVAFALVGFYVSFTQSVLPSSPVGTMLHWGGALLAGLLFVFGALPRRRSPRPVWFFMLWAGAALMVAGVSGQPYAHYLTPAVAPLALCIASLRRVPLHGITRARLRAAGRIAPQLAGVLIAAFMASNAGLDWVSSPTPSSILGGQPINNSRNFGVYYGGAIQAAIGAQTRADWSAGFDSRVPGDTAAADFIRNEGLSGTRAVVWSSDAWVYALAQLINLMPTPPIYNDEVLLGTNGQVAEYVSSLNPVVIVTSTDAVDEFPEIDKVLTAGYVASFWYYPNTVWVRADVATQLP